MADALEECWRKKREGGESGPYGDFPDELGVFWDFPCLFQHPPGGRRTDEEERLFKQALGDLDLWYAHAQTTVVLLTKSGANALAYDERGWPTYESCVARILKLRDGAVWDPVMDVGEPSSRRSLMPPLSIAEFGAAVGALHFTNGADRGVVAGLYERTLRTAFGGATDLRFTDCGWDAAAASSLAASLELCTRLEKLSLSDNEIGAEGLRALARAPLPALKRLELYNMEMGDAGVCALADELPAGAWPALEKLWLTSTSKWPEREAGDVGLKALGRALGRGAMPNLETIFYKQDFNRAAAHFAEGKAAVAAARPGVEVDT